MIESGDQEDKEDMNMISWCGTPYDNLSFMSPSNPVTFPVRPSPNHTVLVRLPLEINKLPRPRSEQYRDFWDTHHVKMPCSPQSLYPHNKDITPRWDLIKSALSEEIKDVSTLVKAILEYNGRYASKWTFQGLKALIEDEFGEEEYEHFFNDLLPRMIKLTLKLPELITDPIPLLAAGQQHTVTFSQLQVACLLANAFFCTFPRRNAKGKNTEYETYPDINFNRLFFHKSQRSIEKLKCIINYFRIIFETKPTGLISFSRQSIKEEDYPDWKNSSKSLPQLHIDSTKLIEDCQGFLQVDFANKFLGGGVLGLGCVQEEIRFVLCPELIISRLITEVLGRNEAVIITGAQQFNKGDGYASTFQWAGTHVDLTPVDQWGRKMCQIVAINAISFMRNPSAQYQPHLVMREIQKAYAGYLPLPGTIGNPVAVATGNWGCGAFKGNSKLKALIQFIACAEAGRDLAYCTFGDIKLRDDLANMHLFLQDNNVTAGQLVKALLKYGKLKHDGEDLVHFIYHVFSSYESDTDSGHDGSNGAAQENMNMDCSSQETTQTNNPKQNKSETQKSCDNDSKDTKKKSKGLKSDQVKSSKTIRDYFKPHSSKDIRNASKPKPDENFTSEQIQEALLKCDKVVSSPEKCKLLNDDDSNESIRKFAKNESRLLMALDDLHKDPT